MNSIWFYFIVVKGPFVLPIYWPEDGNMQTIGIYMDAINRYSFCRISFLYHYWLKDEICRINGICTDAISGNIPLHTVDCHGDVGTESENCF
ncbi:unnamed protein product [Trifolium pratense]|uniref:Uncharacterized protein n=1 Tax=Trifolium pratense TaxID=57577 RepID=A0ACB0IWN9_TRIPR|nr:unnamed protein product [Trifolium pratense]